MAVFSTIYQLEAENKERSNYKEIALRIGLTESSIRDYVQRIMNKGIPLKKQKIDNKRVILTISPDLRKIATLSTIIKLREL
jgi:transposase